MHDDIVRQIDLAAGFEDALVELGVLVRDRTRIPQADRLEHAPPERAEEHGVDEPLGVGRAIARAADAERARERGTQGALEERLGLRALRAADVIRAGALEHLDALADVIGRVLAVHVHANDDVALRRLDELAEAGRLEPLGVVDHLDPRIAGGEAREDVPRAIGRAAVGDEDLQLVVRIVLRLDTRDARLDVVLLVERGHRDRDGRDHEAILARLAGDVQSRREHEHAADRREWVERLAPHECADRHGHEWLGERQHRSA